MGWVWDDEALALTNPELLAANSLAEIAEALGVEPEPPYPPGGRIVKPSEWGIPVG